MWDKYHIVAWCCTPLGVAGFVVVAATVSAILGEPFLPRGCFPELPAWTSSNGACIALAAVVPLPYLVLLLRIEPGGDFFGLRRRIWFVIIAASYGFGVLVAAALAIVLLLLR